MASEKFSFFDWKKTEISFVTVVLLIILGISFFQLKIGERKARDAQRKADVELVARALRKYHDDHRTFPQAQDGKIVACGDMGLDVCEWNAGPLVDVDSVVYLKNIPQDPLSHDGRSYYYEVSPMRDSFRLYIALEHVRDPAWREDLTIRCGNTVQCNWYAAN